jgi:hypothetical protein
LNEPTQMLQTTTTAYSEGLHHDPHRQPADTSSVTSQQDSTR